MTRNLLLPLLAALLANGCVAGYRFSGAALVDTQGQAGLTGGAGGAWGIKTGSDSGVTETLEMGAGPTFPRAGVALTAGAGFDYVHQQFGYSRYGLRVGPRARYLARYGSDREWWHDFGAGGAAALLVILDSTHDPGHEKMGGGGTTYRNLAIELQGYALGRWHERFREGAFFLVLSYEVNSIVDLF
jgi:hypothetical protein